MSPTRDLEHLEHRRDPFDHGRVGDGEFLGNNRGLHYCFRDRVWIDQSTTGDDYCPMSQQRLPGDCGGSLDFMSDIRCIGISTGGGDAPGLNAVIRAAVKCAILKYKWKVIGIPGRL